MRTKLKQLDKKRFLVTAEFSKFGTKTNWNGYQTPTVCFQNIKDSEGNILTDHVWFTVGKRIKDMDLQEGDIVSYEARVSNYRKDYFKDTIDYKLNNPTKFKLIYRDSSITKEVVLSENEIKLKWYNEILSYFSCKSFYELNFKIGKEQVIKLKFKLISFESVKLLNLPKPSTPKVYKPVLIEEHYLNQKYKFNQVKQCYQKKLS